MPKAILEFDLPEDRVEHEIAVHAADWACVVSNMDDILRGWLKYGHEFENIDEALEEARKELHKEMEGWGVSFEMMGP